MIQHVSFEVGPGQVDACVAFYELLGFRRVVTPEKRAHFVTWLERDGDQFHLLELPEPSHMNAGHAAVPLGDDYEAAQARLREAGHQVDDHEEYEPVVQMLREADLVRRGTETESYMRVAHLRYLILRTHSWDDEVIDAVRRELETPSWEEDTMVRRLRKELR